MQYGHVEVRGEVGVLTLDYPPVNALGSRTISAIGEAFRSFLADDRIKAIVIACAGRTFVAGADITEIDELSKGSGDSSALNLVENGGKPVIAAIHGTALGGGYELALMCHYRIAVPSARVGLPEVKLGLLPGGGGTQRLPRIIGIEAALDFITQGDPVAAPRALELGMIDRLAEEGTLVDDAVAFAREIIVAGRPAQRVRDRDDMVRPWRGRPEFYSDYLARHAETFRGFVAPSSIIQAVRAAAELPFAEGMELEYRLFLELVANSQSAAQRHVFFAERQTARVPGIAADTPVRPIRSAAVIGADTLAGDLAAILTSAGLTVLRAAASAAGADLLVATQADKLAEIAGTARDDAILALAFAPARNVSPEQIAAGTSRGQDVIGLGFGAGRLLEMVRSDATAADVVTSVLRLAKVLGRVPVVSRGTGLAGPVMVALERAAEACHARGAHREEIDRAMYDYGFAAGPFGGRGADACPADAERLAADLLYPAVNEAARLVDAGAALRPGDVDVACIHGAGWPVYTGGPLFWAGTEGAAKIVAALEERGHAPASLLIDMAAPRAPQA